MNKRLAVLVVLAALIWGGLWFWPGGDDAGLPELPEQGPWLDAAQLSGVTRIHVAAQGREYELNKGDAGWTATVLDANGDPRTYVAATDKVETLLAFVGHNVPERRLGEVTELAPYGLDNPEYVFTFEGDAVWTLSLGGKNPAGTGFYALASVDPGRCLLLTDRYLEQAEREARAYFDMRLADIAPEQVERVSVEWAGSGWEARRGEEGQGWQFVAPEELADKAVADAEMELLVHELATMEAASFVEDQVLAGDAEPLARAVLWTLGNEAPAAEIEIYPGNGEDLPYLGRASRHEHVFALSADAAEKLDRSAFYMRERSVADVDLSLVAFQVLHQDTDGAELSLVRTDTAWQDQDTGADVAGMDLLLWRLTDLKFEAEPTPELPASATRLLTWELAGEDGADIAVLAFYLDPELPEDQCWIMVQGEDIYYPVSDSLLEDLQGQLLPAEADNVEETGEPETGGASQDDAATTP